MKNVVSRKRNTKKTTENLKKNLKNRDKLLIFLNKIIYKFTSCFVSVPSFKEEKGCESPPFKSRAGGAVEGRGTLRK